MKIKKYKPKFVVLCRIDDLCLFLLGDDNQYVFDTRCAARKAMRRDYRNVPELRDASWSRDGKDQCKMTVLPDEISLDVPIYESENDRKSWLRLRWKVVEL